MWMHICTGDCIYAKAMLLCSLKYNILTKHFRITWSETKRKLHRSFVRTKIQHDLLNSPKHLHSNLFPHRKIVLMTLCICAMIRYIRKIIWAWICLDHSLRSLSAKRSINHYPISLFILQFPQKAHLHTF